jgi:hypothetical protein
MRRTCILGCLLLLCGCTGPLEKLKTLAPAGNDYSSALAAEYLSYADSESEQGRKSVAAHYAEKGLQAIDHKKIEPDIADTSLSAASQQELADARAKLLAVSNDDMQRIAPQKLARAQLLFDCWQHELSRRIDAENAPCAEEFASALTELQDIADGLQYTNETAYTLSFAEGHSRLSAQHKAAIARIARKALRFEHYKIILASNTGDDAHARIASLRQSAISKAFIARGIDASRLKLKTKDDSKAVLLSCDASEKNDHAITVTLKIRK